MSELTCLELSVVIWLAHVFVQAGIANAVIGGPYLLGPRDQKREVPGVFYPRATRALANYVENYGPFIAADLGLIVTQHTGGLGATIWVLARIAYLPLYLFGVPYLRSAVWFVAIAGLIMMLARLAGY